jgi:hypothetical protein
LVTSGVFGVATAVSFFTELVQAVDHRFPRWVLRSPAVCGFHQAAVLLRVLVDGLARRHIDAHDFVYPPRVEAVDDVEQLRASYLHGLVTEAPSPLYLDLNVASAWRANLSQKIPGGRL